MGSRAHDLPACNILLWRLRCCVRTIKCRKTWARHVARSGDVVYRWSKTRREKSLGNFCSIRDHPVHVDLRDIGRGGGMGSNHLCHDSLQCPVLVNKETNFRFHKGKECLDCRVSTVVPMITFPARMDTAYGAREGRIQNIDPLSIRGPGCSTLKSPVSPWAEVMVKGFSYLLTKAFVNIPF
jgi:hypothetical protein